MLPNMDLIVMPRTIPFILLYSTWNYNTITNTITNYFTYLANTGKVSHKLLLGYDYIESEVDLNQQYFENPGQFGTGSGIVGGFQSVESAIQPITAFHL